MKAQVVKQHQARMLAADLPCRSMVRAVVANVVDARSAPIKVRPWNLLRIEKANRGVLLKAPIPFHLVCPKRDLGACGQGGEDSRRVVSNLCLARRQGAEPVHFLA